MEKEEAIKALLEKVNIVSSRQGYSENMFLLLPGVVPSCFYGEKKEKLHVLFLVEKSCKAFHFCQLRKIINSGPVEPRYILTF